MAARATTFECEWARIYQRLLPRLAIYDERTKDYRGKMRVLGRIAGQMATMIFALLKTDQELLSQVPLVKILHLRCSTIQPSTESTRKGSIAHSNGTSPRKIIHLPHPS